MRLWRYGRGMERLGQRYRLDGILGSGGMADVCLAWDEREGREVAIKVMKAGELDQRTLDRFLKEAAQVAQWRHPNVLRMYGEARLELLDAQQGSIVPYIVMEFAQGGDLHKRLQPGQPYPFEDTLAIFAQLCRAVSYAHRQGVIHRDLKPLNILFRYLPDDTEQVVLSDFGLAVEMEATHFTFAGAGTLPYMAPEQLLGHAEAASDIFALGVILYQLCTGRLPFRRSILDLRRREPQPRPPRPSSLNPQLPLELDDLIYTALAEDPAARFPDAILFARCVQAVATGLPLEAISAFDALGQQTLSAPTRRMPPTTSVRQGAMRRVAPAEAEASLPSRSNKDISDVEVVVEDGKMPAPDDPQTQPPARTRNVRQTMLPNVEGAEVDSDHYNYAGQVERLNQSDQRAELRPGTRLVSPLESDPRRTTPTESRIPRRSSRLPASDPDNRPPLANAGGQANPTGPEARTGHDPRSASSGRTRVAGSAGAVAGSAASSGMHATSKFGVPSDWHPVPASELDAWRDSHPHAVPAPITPPIHSIPLSPPPVSKLAPEWASLRTPAPKPAVVSPPTRKYPYLWWYLSAGVALAAFIILASYLTYISPDSSSNPIGNALHSVAGAVSLGSATVTITPSSQTIHNSYTISAVTGTPDPAQRQIAGRALTTSSQKTQTVNGTGKTQAANTTSKGQLTFFNGSFASSFTVNAGTSITGTDGVVVTTDNALIIPVSNPNAGSDSSATVLAHASIAGAKGNIVALDVNHTCCTGGSIVFVKNFNAFTGGQDAKNYTFIQQSDVDGVSNALGGGLTTQAQNALQGQLQGKEQLAGNPQCQTQTKTDQPVGDTGVNIASTIVTVTANCTEMAFDRAQALNMASTALRDQGNSQVGQGYQLQGPIVTQSVPGTITANSVTLQVTAHGTWVYQFSDAIKQQLVHAIAGKSADDAKTRIERQMGVASVSLQGVNHGLPTDPAQIKIVVQPGAG